MYLIPYIRTSRAITSCLLFPQHPIQAIAASELISYTVPFITYPSFILNIIGFTFYLFNDPKYTKYLIEIYKNKNILYYKAEFFSILLFNIYLFIK